MEHKNQTHFCKLSKLFKKNKGKIMSRGIYNHWKVRGRKRPEISNFLKGHLTSEKTRQKISISNKQNRQDNPMRISTEIRQKFSTERKGIHFSPKTEFKKGNIPWNANTTGLKPNKNKGKTFEEIFGETKATERKTKLKQKKPTILPLEWNRILKEAEEFKKQGFRVIPIGRKVIPDIIAIKDGKVFAIEVEYRKPNYNKYTDDIRQFYDDIIWLIRWKSAIKTISMKDLIRKGEE